MAGSISDRSPSFEKLSSKENYVEWCENIQERLNSDGILFCIEQSFKSRISRLHDGVFSKEEVIYLEKKADHEALSLIQKHVTSDINQKIHGATTAKKAWNILKSIFVELNVNENLGSSVEKITTENDFNEGGPYPLSEGKSFCHIFMRKSAQKYPNFPSKYNSMLPSTNVEAIVTFKGEDFKIFFVGKKKRKSFGKGWRAFANKHKLNKGDAMVIDVLESNDARLHLKTQTLRRCTTPPQPDN